MLIVVHPSAAKQSCVSPLKKEQLIAAWYTATGTTQLEK